MRSGIFQLIKVLKELSTSSVILLFVQILFVQNCFVVPRLPFDLHVYDGAEKQEAKRFPLLISSKDFTFVSIFAEPYKICKFKIYPSSSISIVDAEEGDPFHVKVGSISGIVEFFSVNCVVEFDEFSTTVTQAVVRFTSTAVEVLEGKGSYKGKTLIEQTGANERGIWALPPPPSVIFPRDGDEFSTFYFSWLAVESAKKYFVEIALDENFQNPVLFMEVHENRFLPSRVAIRPMSSVYFWRVWYYDGEKMSGYRYGRFRVR